MKLPLKKGLHALKIYRKIENTTKHITAKPSRHTMAFFVPSILQSTGSKYNHFSINAFFGDLWRNDGLITQNTITLWVNMRSRLCAVVETHHHYLHGDNLLTKHIGAYP